MKTVYVISIVLITIISNIQAQTFEWAKALGGSLHENGHAVAFDGDGHVFITGNFSGEADFNPDASQSLYLTSAGGSDVFLSKLDAEGNFIWAKRMGGTGGETANAIAVDANGNIYLTGTFTGDADFNPDESDTYNLTSQGAWDIFVVKFDNQGNFIWARSMGGAEFDKSNSIATDNNGNVYTTGYFRATADFNPDQNTTFNLIAKGEVDIFISKLDTDGNFVYAKGIGSNSFDTGHSIAVDPVGFTYITGSFANTVDFDPSENNSFDLVASVHLPLSTASDIFILKLDAFGNFVWAKRMGGTSTDIGASIALSAAGNVYIGGLFSSTADFNPDDNQVFNMTSAGDSENFVAKLNSSGDFLWATKPGGSNGERSIAIAVDNAENVYTTGFFTGTLDFNADENQTFNLASAGSSDVFVSRLNNSGKFVWAIRMGGTANDVAYSIAVNDSGQAFITGIFNGTADFDPHESEEFNVISNGQTDAFVVKLSAVNILQTDDVIHAQLNFAVYPNPANGFLNIELPENSGIMLLEIYSVTGKCFTHKNLFTSFEVLDLRRLPAGLYFLRFTDSKGNATAAQRFLLTGR